jgi:hypothetical protein
MSRLRSAQQASPVKVMGRRPARRTIQAVVAGGMAREFRIGGRVLFMQKVPVSPLRRTIRSLGRLISGAVAGCVRYCRATPCPRSDQRFRDADGRIDGDPLGGSRARASMCTRECARDLYEAFENIQGIRYASSMNAGAAASQVFPSHPVFHRALRDNVMLDPLKHAARALGYALR